MTSLILLWREEDMSDIRIADDDKGPLLFEFKSSATSYASGHYGFASKKATRDMYNYKVVEL